MDAFTYLSVLPLRGDGGTSVPYALRRPTQRREMHLCLLCEG